MYRFFNALVVEEGERRSLKTSSILTRAVKWFLLLNTDKAWAHLSVFICVQDICLIFTAPISSHRSHRRPVWCTPCVGPEEGFPWLLSQHHASPGNSRSLGLSTLWELSAGLERWFPPTEGVAPWGHVQYLETFLVSGSGGGVRVLLASSELRPGMWLNILQCPGLVVPRLTNAALETWLLLSRLSFFLFQGKV